MIPREVIKTLIRNNSELAWYFIHKLSVDLGIADKRAVSLTQKHVRGRLAESLLFLRDNYGMEEDGATLSVHLSREDLASLSNMTTSNAIRTLSWMAQEKIIELDGRKIKIIDDTYLTSLSKNG
jgi:CRP-like cAMP-binding protein